MYNSNHLSRWEVDELLWMYKNPKDRFLLETEINFPKLDSTLWFPDKSSYSKRKGNLISKEEIGEVARQAGLLLYRNAILDGRDGMPKMESRDIYNLHKFWKMTTNMCAYEMPNMQRKSGIYRIEATHKDMRHATGNYYMTYNLTIDDLLNNHNVISSDFDAQVITNHDDKYVKGKAWPFF